MTGSQIRIQLSRIIDSLILDRNPLVLDDEIPDILSDGSNRDEAIDELVEMINSYREDL